MEIRLVYCLACGVSRDPMEKFCHECGRPVSTLVANDTVLELLVQLGNPPVSMPQGSDEGLEVFGMQSCPKCHYPLNHGKQSKCPGCHTVLHWTCRGQRHPGGCSCGTEDSRRVTRSGRLSVGDPCDHCGEPLHNLGAGITIIRSTADEGITLNICSDHAHLFVDTGFWEVDAAAKAKSK